MWSFNVTVKNFLWSHRKIPNYIPKPPYLIDKNPKFDSENYSIIKSKEELSKLRDVAQLA